MLTDQQLRIMASLLDEAAMVIRMIPDEVKERIGDDIVVRDFLCDELEGSALMLRDQADEL